MHKILTDYQIPFGYDALEPYLTSEINHLHFDKHTAGYIKRYNDEIEKHPDLNTLSFVEAIKKLGIELRKGDVTRLKLFQDGAQAWNHYAFWSGLRLPNSMTPEANEIIQGGFSSLENFKVEFVNAGKSHFGSGWLWLIRLDGQLDLVTTHDADAPIFHIAPLVTIRLKKQLDYLVHKVDVLAVCDLWEHAYYLQYKNDRETYLRNFVNYLMDWNFLDQEKILKL